jgi:hypothetical protein
MTKKEDTIKRLNDLRASASMPTYDPEKVTMSVKEMEELIYRLETPSESGEKPTPPTIADLLRKRNVVASFLDLPRLKTWKGRREDLEKAIEKMELDPRAAKVQYIPAAVARGARTRRPIDTKKMEAAIKKNDKREHRKKIKECRETAKRIALSFGFKAITVFDYLQAKGVTRPPLAGEDLANDIRAFVAQRDKARSQPVKKGAKAPPRSAVRSKRAAPGMLTPATLAELLGKPARAVRIKLRSIEKSIPKAWRGEGRWAFNEAHKNDILKLLKGKTK